MRNLSNLRTVNDTVLLILQKDVATRSSDHLLYCRVCESMNPMVRNMDFVHVMTRFRELGIPGFETVRRARQKLQASRPELAATNEVQMIRTDLEHEFRSYAVGE